MKKILFFCSSYPYPIDDGIKKININLILELIKQKYNVTLVVPIEDEYVPEFFKQVDVIYYTKKRTVSKMIRSILLLQPLYFGLYFDKNILKQIDKKDFDLIYYDFYPLTQYHSKLKNEIFMMPDSMKHLAWFGFKNEKSFIRKVYMFINYLLARVYNQKIHGIKKLYVSDEDIRLDKIRNSYFFKIPADNYDFRKYHSIKSNKNEILFRGVMDFEPNITAVESFYNEVFSELALKYPKVTFKVVGKNPSFELQEKIRKNTVFTGFVEDIFDEMSKSAIHVVPMVSGTGVKTKMLDSIALKRLVFATPKAINGIFKDIDEAKQNGIIIYHNKDEFFYFFDKMVKNELDYKVLVDKAYNYLMQISYNSKIDELFEIVKKGK